MKYTRSFFGATLFLAAIAFFTDCVHAQNKQVIVHLQLINPSPYLADWSSRASTATFRVTNKTGKPIQAKILARICKDGVLQAFTQSYKIIPVTILPDNNDPSSINIFNGEAIIPYSAVKFTNNVDQNSKRAGRIPGGSYTICVTLIDAASNISLTEDCVPTLQNFPVLAEDCQMFNILSFYPPTLILPADGSELCKLGANNVIDKRNGQPMPLFQWTPVVPAPQEPVRYHFAIFEVLPGQSPIAAFRGARSVFETGNGLIPDPIDLTNLLWPTQYFLPEKGKEYIWSVRALDMNGNTFILTNDGWATPFIFTIPLNCDQGATGGNLSDILLINPPVIDFGSVNIGTTSQTSQISLTNISSATISIHPPDIIPPGLNAGFSIDNQPSLLILEPGVGTSFNVVFKATSVGMADGSVRIATDGGNTQVQLKGQGVDASAPTVKITSPSSGESIPAGSPVTIKFNSPDDGGLNNYQFHCSIDGGATYPITINPAENTVPLPPSLKWNVPSDIQTSQGIIKVTAQDKNGNIVSGLSGLFSIGLPVSNLSVSDCSGQPYCATFVSQEVPSCAQPGSSFPVTITMKNTGTETWTANEYSLHFINPAPLWFWPDIKPSSDVSPGSNATFNFTITAPTTPGTYTHSWQMLKSSGGGSGFFGQPSLNIPIQVTPNCTGSDGTGSLNPTNDWMFFPLGMELLSPNGSPLNVPPAGSGNSNNGINMTLNGDGHPPLKLHVVSITAADVNNDGMPDLLLLDDSQGKNILYLLLRKQDGTYLYPQAINTGK